MKKLLNILILLLVPLIFIGCKDTKEDDGKLRVAVSINTIREFTEAIGKDKVNVYTVVKENMEPHDFDFTPADKKELVNRDILIYNGLGLEEWIDQVEGDIELVDASKGVNVIQTDGADDPHVWLSLKEAMVQCKNIKDILIEKDPDNKEYYEKNYENYINEMQTLYDEYKPKFDSVTNKTFVTSHEAFAYLCREFDLEQKAIKGVLNEDVETTFKDMESLANYCKENGIKVIFSEGSESQKDADTLAKAINGKVVPIYTLETKVDGKTYVEAMKDNYDKIYEELK
ncbi:MAG: ABC transporter substrate-binding protein [Clostridium sp.]|nr:ABC transporter substrate-binding protein [Clostridium sp.]